MKPITALVAFVLLFVACKKSGSSLPSTNNALVGFWKGKIGYTQSINDTSMCYAGLCLLFKSNGTFTLYNSTDPATAQQHTDSLYTFDGNTFKAWFRLTLTPQYLSATVNAHGNYMQGTWGYSVTGAEGGFYLYKQ